MAGAAFKDERVVKLAEGFVPVIVDFDTETAWVKRHGIVNTPTVVYADADGEAIATTDDVQPADSVLADMQVALDFLAGSEK